MKLSNETHKLVTFWILKNEIERFDSIAEEKRITRSELIRECIASINHNDQVKL